MTDEHASPIKTPRQLITIVLLAFAVPIIIGVLVSQLVTSGEKGISEDDSKILARIQPVGNVVLADASGPKGALTGEQVYGQVCKACHEAGLAGAPKTGDKAAWSARIAQGEKTLDAHAIGGFQGKAGMMPAKGGSANLTDDEVKRAVVYMADKAGATWKESAPATAAVPPQRRQQRPLRPRPRAKPMARKFSKPIALPAMARASPAHPRSATRPRGRRASRKASTSSTRTPLAAFRASRV